MTRRTTVLWFFASFVVLGISGTLLGPTLDDLTTQFDLPLANGGVFITLHSTGATIALIAMGRLYDRGRIAPRYLLAAGPLLSLTGLIALSVSPSAWLAFAAALLFGLGFGSMIMGPNILLPAMFSGAAAGRLNALNTFYGVGAITGPQVVNLAFGLADYRLAYVITAVAAAALIPAFLRVDIPASQVSERDSDSTAAQHVPVKWRVFLPFTLLLFIYVGAEVGFGAWIATHLSLVGGLEEASANVGVSLFWAGLTGGRFGASLLARRLRAVPLLGLSVLVLLAGSLLVLLFPGSSGVMLVGAFVVGLGCGPVFPTTVAAVSDNYPAQFAAASGLILGVGNGGAMLIPWVQGQVGGGETGGVIVTTGASLLLLGLVAVIWRQIRARERMMASAIPAQAHEIASD